IEKLIMSLIYLRRLQQLNSYIAKTYPICPVCVREVAHFYDVGYALVSHHHSCDLRVKVCIYCEMHIQKEVMDRKLQEYGTYLDENLPDIIPTILKDGEFRSMFQNHLRLYGTIDIICDDKSYIRGRRTFIKMMIEHIY